MYKVIILKIIYTIMLIVVLSLVVLAIFTNISKFTRKQNILKYETVVFEKNSQLKEVIQKNYCIDNDFDFISEVKRINNIKDDESFLGKPLIIPVITSN